MTSAAEIKRNLAIANAAPRGLAGLRFTPQDMDIPAVQKLLAALRDEQALLREHLEPVQNIESTTLLRGQLQAVKQILARADEVGPESRESEPVWPESPSAPAAGRLPEGY